MPISRLFLPSLLLPFASVAGAGHAAIHFPIHIHTLPSPPSQSPVRHCLRRFNLTFSNLPLLAVPLVSAHRPRLSLQSACRSSLFLLPPPRTACAFRRSDSHHHFTLIPRRLPSPLPPSHNGQPRTQLTRKKNRPVSSLLLGYSPRWAPDIPITNSQDTRHRHNIAERPRPSVLKRLSPPCRPELSPNRGSS